MFFIDFMIKKFDYATPGRNGNYRQNSSAPPESAGSAGAGTSSASTQVINVSTFLVDVLTSSILLCMTRLRVTVKDWKSRNWRTMES